MTFKHEIRRYLVKTFVLLMSAALYAQTPDAPQPPTQMSAPAQAPSQTATPAGSIHGLVKSGNMPLPGVTVTASNTLTGQKVTTWTDVDGNYFLEVPSNGRYVIRTQMAAFANATQEALINATNKDQRIDLELILLSRVPPAPADDQSSQQAQQVIAQAMAGRGFQNLQVTQGTDYTPTATADQSAGSTSGGSEVGAATESVAVSGTINNTNWANMSSDEWRNRVEEMRAQGGLGGQGAPGAPGAPGGGPGGFGPAGFGGGGPGFGGGLGGGGFGGGFGGGRGGARNRFNINRPHGTIYYNVGDDALNAAPYNLNGADNTKPSYIQHRFGGAIGGPFKIPHIYDGGNKTFFFLNYNGSRGETPFDRFSTVPTDLERAGDFSQSTVATHGPGGLVQSPVQLFYPNVSSCPLAGQAIPGNDLQNANAACPQISSIATGLLGFYPLPNVPNALPDTQNFHFVTSTNSSSDDFNFRLNRSFGSQPPPRGNSGRGGGFFGGRGNNLSVGIHYHGSTSNLTNAFPGIGGNTDIRSWDIPISYTRSIGKINNSLRFDFNRNRVRTQNLFAFKQDITGTLGITGVSTNPFDWGLPGISFADFSGLGDTNPQLSRNQTYTISDSMVWNRGKHTWRWGGDFRRIQINSETDNNARGTFLFSGVNSGYDLSDFLLGLPQQTTLQFGDNNYHFRGNSWDLFVQDEWRVRGNLSFNLGLRYEYVSPFTEINNLLVNLNVAPEFLTNKSFDSPDAVVPVIAGQNGASSTLVKPDRNNLAPRIGFAWKATAKTVVRGGYGINYNTVALQNIAQQLAFQPPFSNTATNVQTAPGALTLAQGFPTLASGVITNNFGVDPNYHLGYVQIFNLNIQRELRPTLILNADFTNTKGTALDIVEAPNRTPDGVRLDNVQAFNWETSGASSHAYAASLRVRKRLQSGFSVGGTYIFSKAIDDASSIGGGAIVVAQDPFNLAAERGLSSFDQRHRFTGDYMFELPFGHDKHWLRNGGVGRTILGDWQWSGSWTIASGTPYTPRSLNDISDLNRGTNGTIRADVVPGQSISLSNPSIQEWFNTAAFTAPPTGAFGDARRNSIQGPGSLLFNMALNKVFQMKEGELLEFRIQASNVFNTPQYGNIDTNVNSRTFGQVISIGQMRTIQLLARFRF